jgi:hypothetical protein
LSTSANGDPLPGCSRKNRSISPEASVARARRGRSPSDGRKPGACAAVRRVRTVVIMAEDNERQMRELADDVRGVILPGGHQLAEECPDLLAREYLQFFRAGA